MTKYCPECGTENNDNSTFCRSCGKRLSNIHSMNKDTNTTENTLGNNKILIGAIIALILIVAVIGTYAVVTTLNNDNNDSDSAVDSSVDTGPGSSVSDASNVNTKSWHKIDSFSGSGDYQITFNNNNGNKIKVVSTAMPIKNYADNYMYTTVSKNGYNVGSSQLSWNSKSAVATKTDNIQFSGVGTYYIDISAYELQYWNLEIYEYY